MNKHNIADNLLFIVNKTIVKLIGPSSFFISFEKLLIIKYNE